MNTMSTAVEAEPGERIERFCTQLIEMSKLGNRTVTGVFNDTLITARPDSTPSELFRQWSKDRQLAYDTEQARKAKAERDQFLPENLRLMDDASFRVLQDRTRSEADLVRAAFNVLKEREGLISDEMMRRLDAR